jgi:tetratricopeptide (TPR) repeat protein
MGEVEAFRIPCATVDHRLHRSSGDEMVATSSMDHHYFVSYSRVDGAQHALTLTDRLQKGPPSYRVWLDVRELRPGQDDWDDQLVDAIRTCAAVLFLLTEDSVRRGSNCKDEWVRALKYKKPVVPVRLHADAELPFRLGSRHFVDFTDDFEQGLASLRDYLQWTATPAGQLSELRNRLADAERELPRVDQARALRVIAEIDELRRTIDQQQLAIDNPLEARRQAEERIAEGLERERRPEHRPAAAPRFVNPRPMTAPDYFQDRHVETGLIADFLRSEGSRLLSVVGRGGVGKTAMVCRVLGCLESGRLPDDLGELSFDGIVYLSSVGRYAIGFHNLFTGLCHLRDASVSAPLLERHRDGRESPDALMHALLEEFPTGRTILLLDNFEDLLDAETFALVDPALEQALRAVLLAPAHGVKVILTTRFAPRELMLIQPAVQFCLDLDEGLPTPYAEEILRARDLSGRLGLRDAPDALLRQAQQRTRGFPRALEALAAILSTDRDTTLGEILADTSGMPDHVVETLVGEAFDRLDPLAQQVMAALAVYAVPMPAVAVDFLLQPQQPTIDSGPVLKRLVNMQFVHRDAGRYHLHHVDRDYALRRLPGERALHERAAEYFHRTRMPQGSWRTLDDLAPQLGEFDQRCHAGQFDAAARVLIDIGDCLQTWGHYRLAIGLHERLDQHVTDPWIVSAGTTNLANCHHALGEIRQAIELHEQALSINRDLGSSDGEAVNLGNLGLCYAALGETHRAIELHERALAIDRRIGSREGEAADLGNLGLCYTALGETRRAIELHEEALVINRAIGSREGESTSQGNLGRCYHALGETPHAIELHNKALALDREVGRREGEAINLGNLGRCYAALGQLRRALEFHQDALAINREIGHRDGEAIDLGNLGVCHAALGQTEHAIELHEQALAIDEQIRSREGEAADLGNLGLCFAALGETHRALGLYQDALTINVKIGNREGQAFVMGRIGTAYADLGSWGQAIWYCREAVNIADEIEFFEARAENRLRLAEVSLHAGELADARVTAEATRDCAYVPTAAASALVLGAALLAERRNEAAKHAFREALRGADALLAHADDNCDALDTRALALCGLAVVDDAGRMSEASAAFRAARTRTRAAGVVDRTLRLFDRLAARDRKHVLQAIRPVAAGDV